jgi:hypothetical protein
MTKDRTVNLEITKLAAVIRFLADPDEIELETEIARFLTPDQIETAGRILRQLFDDYDRAMGGEAEEQTLEYFNRYISGDRK